MGAMASQISSLVFVYSTVYSGADQRKTSKLCVTGLCEGNSPVTGEFPTQRASNEENVSIWWRHHVSTSASRKLQFCGSSSVGGFKFINDTWALRRPLSPVTWLFVQELSQANNEETIKALQYGNRSIPRKRGWCCGKVRSYHDVILFHCFRDVAATTARYR